MNSVEPVGEAASHQPYRRITGFPQPGFQDHVRDGIKVAVAAIPLVGGAIDELIDVVIRPSLAKRREHWCQVRR